MNKRKLKKQKKSKLPTFIAGTVVGALTGLVLAKKSGSELINDATENFGEIKEKAKEMYNNKDKIIDNINRNIQKVTKMEIKNFDEPEYYSKEFNE